MSCADQKTEPFALDLLLTDDQRRPLDEIDRMIDDHIVIDPYEVHGPSRKSDADLNRVLAILDNLESGKEITR